MAHSMLRSRIIRLASGLPAGDETRRNLLAALATSHGDEGDTEAMFEKGKPADPCENMSEAECDEWKANTEKYKDKFDKEGARSHTAGSALPRATRRPPGPKFRDSISDWIEADVQEKLESAGVPQKNIDVLIRRLTSGGVKYKDFDGGYRYFTTQQEAVAWLAGKFEADIGGIGSNSETYPKAVQNWIDEFGAGVGGYRDKVKGLLNKMSPQQKALAHWAWIEGQYPRNAAAELEKSLDDSSKQHYEKMIPIMEWALKVSQSPKA